MFYRPRKANKMWDTWLYYHDGLHYLYYLRMLGPWADGVSLAISKDGVYFEEVGPIIQKQDDAEWLGTGSVWKAGQRFIMNFSEKREGVQAVFFAESNDLVHWQRLGDEYRCDPDPRWYDNTPTGRWDCIWTIARPTGGFWGYLTARPWSRTPGMVGESVGMVESEDGLHWHAVAPPSFEWGEWPQMNVREVGAIEKIGNLYYLMLAYGEDFLGNRQVWDHLGGRYGMYMFVADDPKGPFRPDTQAYRLLVSNGAQLLGTRMTYFSRFYPTPGEMLVNHHSVSRSDIRWLAPLKKAIVDDEGHLRLGYWPGNDAVKGQAIEIDLASHTRVYPPEPSVDWTVTPNRLEADESHGGGLVILDQHFDLERGVVLEGTLGIYEPPRRWSGIGVFVEETLHRNQGTGILLETRGRTEIGTLRRGYAENFQTDDIVETGIAPGKRCSFRLLLRRSLMEFYLDDLLIQCYSLPEQATGRLGLVFESGRAVFEDLKAWEMDL